MRVRLHDDNVKRGWMERTSSSIDIPTKSSIDTICYCGYSVLWQYGGSLYSYAYY